ncbi:hypothetical protein CDAR_296971 [Caerostris darwini]|uniref:Uncharacterized protein n=1 Tax=Caerostris darwini TaxID=1538125 RepID=A0AAV4N154_9ARAC|nr:hypothetical protein CDAR_296971 [Caerostris darwini]
MSFPPLWAKRRKVDSQSLRNISLRYRKGEKAKRPDETDNPPVHPVVWLVRDIRVHGQHIRLDSSPLHAAAGRDLRERVRIISECHGLCRWSQHD